MAVSENVVIEKCRQAGVSFWIASEAALRLKGKLSEKATDLEINKKILSVLKEIDSEAASQFESYHSIEVITSSHVLETFNRDKITKSLIKETRIPKAIAEDIAKEVEKEIRRAQIRTASTSLIRELVNAELLERKLINAQSNYTRAGIPVFDIKRIIDKKEVKSPGELNELFGNRIMEEFVINKLLSKEVSLAYLSSDLYIHAIEDFATLPYAFNPDLRVLLKHGFVLPGVVTTGPAKNPEVAMSHAARFLTTAKSYVARGIGFDFFNFFLAPFISRKSKKQVKQYCQTFLYELNRANYYDNTFAINLEVELPEFLKEEKAIGPKGEEKNTYENYYDEALLLAEVFIDMMKKGDYSGREFRHPSVCLKLRNKVPEKLIDKELRPVYYIRQEMKNSSLVENLTFQENSLHGLGSGIIQTVSLNLPKVAKLNPDDNAFYEKLGRLLELTKETVKLKLKLVKEKAYKTKMLEFLAQSFEGKPVAEIERFKGVVLFTGLSAAAKLFLKKENYDKECLVFSERILRFTHKKLREFKKEEGIHVLVGESDNVNALTRFTAENKKHGIEEDISRSSFFQELDDEKLIDVLSALQPLYNAGSFYETSDKNLLKSKEILFLKLF